MSTLSRTLVLLRELARRKVAHVAVLYGVGWFGALQVTQQFTQVYQLPQVISVIVSIGAVLLFPCVVFLSWCFDCTAEGVRRAPPTEELFAHERVVRVIVMVALVL
ncbi:MAG TPA: hypothetical protein VK864_12055, partial [Longimicrobiales bacterium]|nr:hypothetical protein [Longimicrobiales bacterium]